MRRALVLLALVSACERPPAQNPPEVITSKPPQMSPASDAAHPKADVGVSAAPEAPELPHPRFAEVPEATRQVVWVRTGSWAAKEGTMARFERDGQAWRRVGEPVRVMVGRGGLGWGRGLHGEGARGDPVKAEGDGRAPAGVFRLSGVFGHAREAPSMKMAYTPIVPGLECVDDPKSRHYNRLLMRGSVKKVDWGSAERMSRMGSVYRWGVLVDHNVDPPRPGAGSCIFMHVWAGPGVDTVGCTSMAPEVMESLLEWLDAEAEPVLVQVSD